MAGNLDSERLLKFIGYFPDYLSALFRTLLRFFGQPLSKQLFNLSNGDLFTCGKIMVIWYFIGVNITITKIISGL